MNKSSPSCRKADHSHARRATPPESLDRAAQLFRAMGDGPRLRILQMLTSGELCVTEIVAAMKEKFSTVSQRLRILRSEGLVVRRRSGTHLFYALSDRHVTDLIQNALAHANELDIDVKNERRAEPAATFPGRRTKMATHKNHKHKHGPGCGHTPVKHEGHTDYLHDGHLHHMGKAGVEEHQLTVSKDNPAGCTPKHSCGEHDKGHKHGPGCGHEAVPHGDHTDYLVAGHLHHPHGDHCDDHGKL
jgi:DNA-binding transcriptional ArsR family regulator